MMSKSAGAPNRRFFQAARGLGTSNGGAITVRYRENRKPRKNVDTDAPSSGMTTTNGADTCAPSHIYQARHDEPVAGHLRMSDGHFATAEVQVFPTSIQATGDGPSLYLQRIHFPQ